LRSLVSTAKKQDDGCPILTVIHAIARPVKNAQFPNSGSDETAVPEISTPEAIDAPKDRNAADGIVKATEPFSKKVFAAGNKMENLAFMRLHLSVSYKRHIVKGAWGAGG